MSKLKVIFLLFTFSFLLFTLPSLAFAQTLTPLPPTVSPVSPLYTDLLVHNLFHSFSCLAVGQSVIGQPCLTYQMTKNAQGMIQGVPMLSSVNTTGGVLGTTTSLIGALYDNRPVRTADYLASINLGIAKEANAQVFGSGAAVLNPILTLWQTSRNISYVLMIIIFLIIGLMVMFRNKINPQTVITAQAALPGLVIGLILITFSYFFAGLISDMAFVGTNVVGYYFAAAQGPDALKDTERINLAGTMSNENILSIFSKFVGIVTREKTENAVNAIFNNLSGEVQGWLKLLVGFITAQFVSPLTSAIPPPLGLWLGPLISLVAGGVVGTTTSFWLGFILSFIAMLALIYQMLKLLLRLISSYLTIIFLTISAPFQFLFASLPGRQGVATGWILNMLGNILIFPTVLAVFYFVAFILGQSFGPLKVSINQKPDNPFVSTAHAGEINNAPNMIVGKDSFPLFGRLDLSFIKILLAFGALMALPSIPDLVIKSIGKAGQAGQILGQEISGGIRSGRGYLAQGQNAVGGQLGGWNKAFFGETSGPIWNPEHTPIYDRAGNLTGYKGGFSFPRRPGLIR